MCEIFADAGQQKVIVLPDKSTVELKANSSIAFNSNFTKKREVKLDGEAVFNVVKMEGVPFTVTAKGAEIIVKGTKFHFKAYSDSSNIEAVLIQGAIDFSTHSHNVALKPNQKVVYDKGSRRVNIIEVDAELEVFGKRFFDAEPLGTVINALEQVYDCRISFTDARMENIKFTGTIDRSNLLDHTLKIVTLTTGTSFRRDCSCGNAILSWERIDIVDGKAVWTLTTEQSASLPVGKYAIEVALHHIASQQDVKDATIDIINVKTSYTK